MINRIASPAQIPAIADDENEFDDDWFWVTTGGLGLFVVLETADEDDCICVTKVDGRADVVEWSSVEDVSDTEMAKYKWQK